MRRGRGSCAGLWEAEKGKEGGRGTNNRGVAPGLWKGAAAAEQSVAAVAAHAADAGQLLYGSGTSVGRSVCGAHPEGGAGRRMCFALLSSSTTQGQIRLELTAEDIQLDCACHSVASIRASPRAFVFAVAEKRERCAPCLFVSFPFMSTSSSGLLHYDCY